MISEVYISCYVRNRHPEGTIDFLDRIQNISNSRFIGQNHMVVGQDSGALVLVNLTKERDGDTLTHYLETQVEKLTSMLFYLGRPRLQ